MKPLRLLLFLLVVFTAAGCGDYVNKNEIVAVVDGHYIDKNRVLLKANMYNIKISDEKEARQFLNLFINNYLILQEAGKDNIGLTGDEVEAEIGDFVPGYSKNQVKKFLKTAGIKYRDWRKDVEEKALIKKEIDFVAGQKVKVSERELKDYFWSNLMRFRKPGMVRARQIVTDTREKADEVLLMLKKGEPFEVLAEKYSNSSETKNGGDLGYFGEGEMPAFITGPVYSLKKGEISGVVKTPYGYHIFKCEDIQQAETPSFEQAKAEVYSDYFEKKKDEYFNGWMREIRKKAVIEIKEDNLKKLIQEEQ